MITWAFAYLLVNGIEVPWYGFIVAIFIDLVMVAMISEGMKGYEPKD